VAAQLAASQEGLSSISDGTNIKTQSSHIIYTCSNWSPGGRDVQGGLTDRMVYQRHVGGFLVFPVCGARFNMQDLRCILWPPSYACWANFDFSSRPWVRLY
jgi:hypothetical protein